MIENNENGIFLCLESEKMSDTALREGGVVTDTKSHEKICNVLTSKSVY